ncbi:MAG: uroporphyrinogen-III synthase [Burkholderiaceae bacterium]
MPVIVTRPAEAGRRLVARLAKAGHEVWWWPAFEIAPAADVDAVRRRLATLTDFDLVILVSPAAVAAVAALQPHWPAGVAIAAVGAGTAAVARATFGAGVEVVAPRADATESGSEALWQQLLARGLPRRVLIARAEQGREWLAAQLVAAGIEFERLAVYRRLLLTLGESDREQLVTRIAGAPPQLIVTSSEAVEGLVASLQSVPGALAWAQAGRVLAIHARIRQRLLEAGFAEVELVAADDDSMLAQLESHSSAAL